MRRKVLWSGWALSVLAAGAAAQSQEQVDAVGHQTKNVPATGGNEGSTNEVGPPPPDAIPMPELDPANDRPLPPGFQTESIAVDAFSGQETRSPVFEGEVPGSEWIVGSVIGSSMNEESQSWNSDLTPIDSDAYPWSAACRIYFDDSSGSTYVCTGTMIDPEHVITAGHCVHEGSGGNWYGNFRIYPAWDGDSDAYGSSGWSGAASFTDWTVNGSFSGDMGFINLSRPVGYLTGWFGYGWTSDDSFFTNNLFNMAGYPANSYSGSPDQLYYGWGSYDSISSTILTADTYWTGDSGGMSGTGSYWINGSGNRYVYGNHSHRCYGCNPNTIGSTRMTQGKFDYFYNDFRDNGQSRTEPDYVPLDVNITTEGRIFTAGDSLTSLNYLVANAALYNPIGTQNYPVDVYLSTNDNISEFDTLIQSHSFNWNFSSQSTVRVNATGPTIPADTASGSYWVGVILGNVDTITSNNDTDGWDAAPLTVTGCDVGFKEFGVGLHGSGRFVPKASGRDSACQAGGHTVEVRDGLGGARGHLWMGLGQDDLDLFGGHFYIDLSGTWAKVPVRLNGARGVPGAGFLDLPGSDTRGWQGLTVYTQFWFFDDGAPQGVSLTQGLEVTIDY